ncbi:MAG: ThuA domain-containing protein [Verrucomicrobia bacterium]|nr:ThuA domain-containing protein [Verrucomicrobiota bacterium]
MQLPKTLTLLVISVTSLLCLNSLSGQDQDPNRYAGKKALFILGEHEYGTPETLPEFARKQLEPLGIESTFIFAEGNDRESLLTHTFRGIEALDSSDILILSLRRRYPETEDLMRIREWILSGKPVVMVRTSSHAFGERPKGTGYKAPDGHAAWNTFDVDVLGASYQGHDNSKEGQPPLNVVCWFVASANEHPIVRAQGSKKSFLIGDKLYKYIDLDPALEILLSARYAEGEPVYPVAWTNEKDGKRVFYTSLGSIEEMALPQMQSLLKAAVQWGLDGSAVAGGGTISSGKRLKIAGGTGLTAEKSHDFLVPAEGLEIDLIASEPDLIQPSFLRFDERGRMWVVQYRQYPHPAGLEIVTRDQYWRNTYNQVPPPPGDPNFVAGADVITIHEDTNGDGDFDKITPFLEGLNLATGVAWDGNGVWVLQPPYLLFYNDADHDDVVDGPPEVHLTGFGIQDSHSIANSLNWGPDGWLYGAQGSTVTASITVTGRNDPPIKSVGQLMWRFHPKKHIYERFAEGGGNIWSCQFDAQGRLFAGANEGGKLGYHYMQGSYNRKTFTKHGELSNPYAYGYFMGVQEPTSQRVTTNLMIYEEGVLPSRYEHSILTANPLAGQVLASRRVERGPSFHSEPIDTMIDSADRWFRPVYTETGPDGAVYVADWYDKQINHYGNHEGKISVTDGRIYRIRNAGTYKAVQLDLGKLNSRELVELLRDKRRWYRETARRLLNQRQDRSVLPHLRSWLLDEKGQTALEALWVINLLGGFDKEVRRTALNHENPFVRKWAVRLIGDERNATGWELSMMRDLAAGDPNVEVRQQLASTAKRLQSLGGLAIVHELMMQDEDAEDTYMPLLVWWALEAFCSQDANQVVGLFQNHRLFDRAMVQKPLLEFVIRRLASEGSRDYLRACARLLNLAPDKDSKATLLKGFEDAYRGRSMTGLPTELLDALTEAGGGSLAMQVRQGITAAVEKAEAALKNSSTKEEKRRRIIEALGEVPQPGLLDTLLSQLNSEDHQTQEVTLSALRSYNDPTVGARVSLMYPKFDPQVRTAAQTLLVSRAAWAARWLQSVVSGSLSVDLIPTDAVESMRRLNDKKVDALIKKIWKENPFLSDSGNAEMDRIRVVLESSKSGGDRFEGRQHFMARCAACHSLHNEGGDIGPELTGYQRHDRESLLLAITNPSAEIREGFENTIVRTKDGQTLAGFIADKDEHVLVLRPVGGQPVVIEQSNIQSMEDAGMSLMPSGLMTGLDEKSIIDLFAYLQSPQPLNLKK